MVVQTSSKKREITKPVSPEFIKRMNLTVKDRDSILSTEERVY